MHTSLARLLQEVIDYAGLFPPAKLDMREAVREYCDIRQSEDSWIVSRFICPAGRLQELEQELSRSDTPDCIPLSVVGAGGITIEEFEVALEQDAQAMNRFEDAMGEKCSIEAFEVKAPSAEIERVMHDLEGFGDVDVFIELPWGDRQHDALAALAESEWLGAKARTGGLDPSAFPPSGQLAKYIRQCMDLDLPFKLTAGLHHPIRHDNSFGATEHGFLNVLCAAAIAESHELGSAEIERILEERDGSKFVFGESGFGWNDLGASLDDIESIRGLFVSYGSCSVDEPLEGLRKLDLV
jgi:hypothetical protein